MQEQISEPYSILESNNPGINIGEVKEAELIWEKSIHISTFAKEIQFLKKKNRCASILVSQFGLFIDEHGTLRSKERIKETSLPLSNKAPAMLPTKHCFTELVIQDTRERVFTREQGVIRNTLATVKERF